MIQKKVNVKCENSKELGGTLATFRPAPTAPPMRIPVPAFGVNEDVSAPQVRKAVEALHIHMGSAFGPVR